MFIKKDTRKIAEIMRDADDVRESIMLSRRGPEFAGSLAVLRRHVTPAAVKNTTFLSLYNNGIEDAQDIAVMASAPLEELNLGGNRLGSLPPGLAAVSSLKRLELDDNALRAFPAVLLSLPRLELLRMSGNGLAALPADVASLSQLSELILDRNALEEVPEALFTLSRLRKLMLGNNKLRRLPAGIGRLTKLEILGVNSNALSELPADVGKLRRMKRFLANGNRLGSVPSEMAHWSEAEHVNLANNDIASDGVPPALRAAWAASNVTVVPPLPADAGAAAHGDVVEAVPDRELVVVLEGNPAVVTAFKLSESDFTQGVAVWKKQVR